MIDMNIKKILPPIFVFGGLIGEFFSFLITIEKFHLAENAGYIPPCTYNPLISCLNVMKTWQASVFGFPNPLLGIAGFAIIVTIGMAMWSGASFRRWFWLGAQAGLVFAVGLIYWLFFQSVYRIGALCPYCMVVWTVTIPIFWYTLVYNLSEGHIGLPKGFEMVREFALRYHWVILAMMYLVIITAILTQFWDYWRTLL